MIFLSEQLAENFILHCSSVNMSTYKYPLEIVVKEILSLFAVVTATAKERV